MTLETRRRTSRLRRARPEACHPPFSRGGRPTALDGRARRSPRVAPDRDASATSRDRGVGRARPGNHLRGRRGSMDSSWIRARPEVTPRRRDAVNSPAVVTCRRRPACSSSVHSSRSLPSSNHRSPQRSGLMSRIVRAPDMPPSDSTVITSDHGAPPPSSGQYAGHSPPSTVVMARRGQRYHAVMATTSVAAAASHRPAWPAPRALHAVRSYVFGQPTARRP